MAIAYVPIIIANIISPEPQLKPTSNALKDSKINLIVLLKTALMCSLWVSFEQAPDKSLDLIITMFSPVMEPFLPPHS